MIYANEIDPVACAALRHCGMADHVDERSIKDVRPPDLRPFRRAHFFAGAGLWEVACRLAGWPADLPLWTASCPCQPFSVAGKGAGTDDPRHLWPDLFRLVHAERPACIVGEQVAGKAGDAWLDGVGSDLESIGYAFRAVEVPASAVDAPQKRSRNWWVAMADPQCAGAGDNGRAPTDEGRQGVDAGRACLRQGNGASLPSRIAAGNACEPMAQPEQPGERWRLLQRPGESLSAHVERPSNQSGRTDDGCGGLPMADAEHAERRPHNDVRGGSDAAQAQGRVKGATEFRERHDPSGAVVRPVSAGLERYAGNVNDRDQPGRDGAPAHRHAAAPDGSFWADAEWLQCADGKARRIPRRSESCVCVLDHGVAGEPDFGGITSDPSSQVDYSLLVQSLKGRTDLWRLAGNSIVPQVAANVLASILETA